MTDVNISAKVTDKPCSRNEVEAVNMAIDCLICNAAVIVEYNEEQELIAIYDFDPYYFNNQRILHRHPADTRTKNRVLERTRVEKRLLHDVDSNDYHYDYSGRGTNSAKICIPAANREFDLNDAPRGVSFRC